MNKLLLSILLGGSSLIGAKKDEIRAEHTVYTLPALGYDYNALEPHIDAATMKVHHTGHHQTYIDNLNKIMPTNAKLANKSLEILLAHPELLPVDVKQVLIQNGGGHYNHSFFWTLLRAPQSSLNEPSPTMKKVLQKMFGSFNEFKQQFEASAKSVFGSGWVWLCLDKGANKLVIVTTANQDTIVPLGYIPVLGLDVWEHAYYLAYQNKRVSYIQAWWHVINWPQVEMYYNDALKGVSFTVKKLKV